MNGFDYLHDPKPALLRRLAQTRLPQRVSSALFVLGSAIAFVSGAWGIEDMRLHAALKMESQVAHRYDDGERVLARTRVAYAKLRREVELDNRLRSIANSGAVDARRLAEIADRLPAHAWLTAIARDEHGMTLDGEASNLAVLSATIMRFAKGRTVTNPTLLRAESDGRGVRYELRLEDATP